MHVGLTIDDVTHVTDGSGVNMVDWAMSYIHAYDTHKNKKKNNTRSETQHTYIHHTQYIE